MSRSNNRKPVKGHDEQEILPPDEPFEFQGDSDGQGGHYPVNIEAAVFQALGAASTCWTKPNPGVFMDKRAVEIGRKLLVEIEKDFVRRSIR